MTTPYILLEGCKVLRVIDGDTHVSLVEVPGLPPWEVKVREKDSWSAELKEPLGPAAAGHARSLLLHELVTLKIPYKVGKGLDQLFTFDRLVATTILKDGSTFAELMRAAGHATKTKPRKARAKK